jgi:hypothetical protein
MINWNAEMRVSDVRNWILNNKFNKGCPSDSEQQLADMLEKNYSRRVAGYPHKPSLDGAYFSTWEVEHLFKRNFKDGERVFKLMSCDVITYHKDSVYGQMVTTPW